MEYTATFSSKGQLTFPSALRRAGKIKSGHRAIITPHPKKKNVFEVKISTESSREIIERLAGSLHHPGMKYIPIEEAREIAGRALGEKYGPNSSQK